MTRQIVATDRLAPPLGPFSAAAIANGLLYVSGQVGLDPATGQLVAGGVAGQTGQVLRNIACVLDAAGCSLADVVKGNVYLADMDDFPAMNAAYERHFCPDDHPGLKAAAWRAGRNRTRRAPGAGALPIYTIEGLMHDKIDDSGP